MPWTHRFRTRVGHLAIAAGSLASGAIDSTTFATAAAAVVVGVVAGALAALLGELLVSRWRR